VEVLASHRLVIDTDVVIETVRSPDQLETSDEDKLIAQKRLNEHLEEVQWIEVCYVAWR
jgi:hypothetical protein